MSRDVNLSAQEKLGELINNGEIDRLDEVFGTNVVDHDPAPGQASGVQGIKDFWTQFLTAFPDLKIQPEALVADEQHVTVVLTVSGTHQGTFQGLEPTGQQIQVRGIQVGRFEDGKIVERWGATDEAGMMKQLGQ